MFFHTLDQKVSLLENAELFITNACVLRSFIIKQSDIGDDAVLPEIAGRPISVMWQDAAKFYLIQREVFIKLVLAANFSGYSKRICVCTFSGGIVTVLVK